MVARELRAEHVLERGPGPLHARALRKHFASVFMQGFQDRPLGSLRTLAEVAQFSWPSDDLFVPFKVEVLISPRLGY